MYRLLYRANEVEMKIIVILNILVSISEIAALVLLQATIDAAFPPLNRMKIYLYILGVGIFLLMRAACNHNLNSDSFLISAKSKNAMILMIYDKILSLSKNVVDQNEIGKILNLISNDFNTIDYYVKELLVSISFPIRFIAVLVLLFARLGWMCIFLFVLVGLIIGMQFLLGKLTGNYLKEINIEKDKRIKIYT